MFISHGKIKMPPILEYADIGHVNQPRLRNMHGFIFFISISKSEQRTLFLFRFLFLDMCTASLSVILFLMVPSAVVMSAFKRFFLCRFDMTYRIELSSLLSPLNFCFRWHHRR
jgi:hypothetical protein